MGSDHVTGARLSDGREIAADFVVVGVGVTPGAELAQAAGLVIDNGIATDAHGRTSDPAIWAAGDCASFPYQGGRIRLESVGNAIDQAETIAANILGADQPYHAKPWFWSDQYDSQLQIVGLNRGHERVVVQADDSGNALVVWYVQNDRVIAADCINSPKQFMRAKKLVANRTPVAEL